MKKQVKKIALKTDRIVNLSKIDAQNIMGGRPKQISVEVCGSNTPGCPVKF